MPAKNRIFSRSSPFDEALSKPLVRRDESESGRSGVLPPREPKRNSGPAPRGPPAGTFSGYRPPSAVPSSASSVVSSDEEGASSGGRRGGGSASSSLPVSFDPALSAAFAPEEDEGGGGKRRNNGEREELLLREVGEELRHTDLDEAVLRERNTELTEVRRSMGIVAEIQRDLATIVHGQQSDIDDVEANAADTAEAAGRGIEHLEWARGHMREGSRFGPTFAASLAATGVAAMVLYWMLR